MHIDPSDIRLSITPFSAVSYIYHGGRPRSERFLSQYKDNFQQIRTDNLLSMNSARKVRRAINWLVSTSNEKSVYSKEMKKYIKYRLSFITLTLPSKQVHSDLLIKKECLNVFLQWIRDRFNVTKYVWRAEIQKNGNIHFHITMDKFVYHKDIRRAWNRNIEKLGYVSRFEEIHGHRQPPSTEIRAVKKAKNLSAYLTAYLTKNKSGHGKKMKEEYNSRIIEGRLFGVSSYLSGIKPFSISADVGDFFDVLRKLRHGSEREFVTDFSNVFYYDIGFLQHFICYLSDIYGGEFITSTGLDRSDLKSLLVAA